MALNPSNSSNLQQLALKGLTQLGISSSYDGKISIWTSCRPVLSNFDKILISFVICDRASS